VKFRPLDFDLFQGLKYHFELVRSAIETLRRTVEGLADPVDAYLTIQSLERSGDGTLRNAIRQLDRQLIDFPPREDTRRVLHSQDRILDAAEHLAGLLAAYRLQNMPDSAVRLARILEACACTLAEAITVFGEAKRLSNQLDAITDLENEASSLCLDAIQDLVNRESDTRRLFMLHEVYCQFARIATLFEDSIQMLEDCNLKAPADA
jgi:uncharacterized protein Yka (UPF0111/DUF47 family)